MKIHPSGRAGFTLTEVMIVAGIIGLLAEIAIPNYLSAKQNTKRSSCISNLRTIDNSKQMWALESLRPANSKPTLADIEPFMNHGIDATEKLYCPSDRGRSFVTSYDPGDLLNPPTCLIDLAHLLE